MIAAGIARVVSAIEDPNPEVAGQGHARLRAAGISVDIGLCADEAARDHAGHFRRIRDKRPHVILKLAVSSDDKIGAAGRKPVAITGEAARSAGASVARAMRRHPGRDRHRAGGRSAARPAGCPAWKRARRCGSCWIEHCACPATSRLVHSARETPLWVMTSDLAEAPAAMKLGAAGAQVIRVAPTTSPPGLDLSAVLHALVRKRHHQADGGRRRAGGVVHSSRPASSMKSGCCAGRMRSAPMASPRWTQCRSPPSRSRRTSGFVLAKTSIRIPSPSTSAFDVHGNSHRCRRNRQPDADGAGPVAPPAHRLPLRSGQHRRRRLDRLQRRLPDRGRFRRRAGQDLVRRRCRRRNARHDHRKTLGRRNQAQSRARAEDRR